MKQDKDRVTNHKRLLVSGNKLRADGGREGWKRWGGWMVDTGAGMCCGEHGVLCKTDASQICTPESNNTLDVNNN